MSEIVPEKQTVFKCLAETEYRIDFYQREYVWSKETVETLLNDIFFAFEQSYAVYKESELTKEVLNSFGWYYLNVIMISKEDGASFIVDGQQRLTTLVLLCAKLYHTTKDERDKKLLSKCIYGANWREEIYYIDHEKRKRVMESIMLGTPMPTDKLSRTEENIRDRYRDISCYIDDRKLDEHKLTAFIFFSLYKLVLVELDIEKYTDTPMIFEVINDRGESLKPFEILKGKLVGTLSHSDSQSYSDKWDAALNRIKRKEDQFFQTYIKARVLLATDESSESRNTAKETRINNEYHRYIFEDNPEAERLGLRKSDKNRIANIKHFIDEDLEYYTKLFEKIINSSNLDMRYCREIFDVDSQYQIILAACVVNDINEENKICSLSHEVERLNMLLRLNGIYESQRYQNIIYRLTGEVKEKTIEEYREIFNKHIIKELRERQAIPTASVQLLDYGNFSKLSYSTQRYFYYLFARVEEYLCKQIGENPQNDVFYMSTKHSARGYHIEHIFSDNASNRALFDNNEGLFIDKRNDIGALLLLKGIDNISSGNEEYADKLNTYSHGTVWAHTLCVGFYNANPLFTVFNDRIKRERGVEFTSYDSFTQESIEERRRLLYELVKEIWQADEIEVNVEG